MELDTSRVARRSALGVWLLAALFGAFGLLVVAGIVVVTLYVLVPSTSVAQEQAARQQMIRIRDAAERYHLNHGEYPETVEELAQPDAENGDKPYLSNDAVVNPWGRPFRLRPPQDDEPRLVVITDIPGGRRL